MQLVESRYAPGLRQPRHRHEPALIALVAVGKISEKNERCGEARGACGDLVVVPPRSEHEVFYGEQGAKLFTLAIDDEVGPYRWLFGGPPSALFTRAIDEWRVGAEIEEVVTDLVAAIREFPARAVVGPAARPAIRELASRLGESRVTVAGAARALGMHPVALARAFRREIGCSITFYKRRAQLRRAAAMLADPGMPLADVALEAGFTDQSHFCRIFKRELGLPPSRFRALAV